MLTDAGRSSVLLPMVMSQGGKAELRGSLA